MLVTLSLFGVGAVYSQQISGKVTTPDDVNGAIGVNILKKGTLVGTVTDIDGMFTINATKGDTLVFSYVGMETKEIEVGDETFINVGLKPQLKALSEVVVTALGIKRSEKALGYSVQKVNGDEIAKVKELDVINALSGKVSGVFITQGGGGIGGGDSRIVIRGESSLAGNNDPLYIINGIPGQANDVAPDDIESISVLKGSAAAALYGSKAGAGVIMITTKSGKGSKETQIEANSNVTFQTPLVLPHYQNSFGQGKGGVYSYYDGNNGG
ncbi:MAG: TonB-dependent receptor plug domain-containing protein, partial [Candidatus Methanofastidiosa archaeon]|nr:TonB-dependent receptor plug domain-containing protein [Candidatus Methanofastidiosa archaeon]